MMIVGITYELLLYHPYYFLKHVVLDFGFCPQFSTLIFISSNLMYRPIYIQYIPVSVELLLLLFIIKITTLY